MAKYVLALDQGTTSSRAIVFDHAGSIVSVAQQEFPQIYPSPGLVEHDPEAIWSSQLAVAQEALRKAGASASDVAALGITNQRETAIVWDKSTGKPVFNAIVWQSRLTVPICDALKAKGFDKEYRRLVGIDAQGFGADGSVSTISFCYAPWEHVHYIKHGIERSGWKSKKDNPGFIQALEGFQAKASLDFPQGDKVLRAQDHQVLHDQYIERVEQGKIVVKEYLPKEKVSYEAKVDYTKEKV